MIKYMVSVSWKNWGNWPFRCGKMLKKRKKIGKFLSKNLTTIVTQVWNLMQTVSVNKYTEGRKIHIFRYI